MANILDYVYWRGDLDFSVSPFNEVDAAVLAMLSYLDIQAFMPAWDSDADISLRETSVRFFSKIAATGIKSTYTLDPIFNASLEQLLHRVINCPRFEGLRLSHFVEDVDFAVGRQFAAVTFTLPGADPVRVVAFRGTDNTMVGWKEDFELAYMEHIPAQDSARRYLECVLTKLPGQFIVCGHSKGGNLALYAAAHLSAPDRERIGKIINFDGPGFDFSLVDRSPYALCEPKIDNFVPQESMIGMLFDSVGERTVVSSTGHAAGQHNAFRWEVERTQFARGELASVAKLLDHTLNAWLAELPLAERAAFLEALFDLLGASEGAAFSSDPLQNLKALKKTLRKYSQLDAQKKAQLNQAFDFIAAQTRRSVSTSIRRRLPGG